MNCHTQTTKMPNFVTLDFYELGDGLNAVNQLNALNTSLIDVNNSSNKKLLSMTDIMGRKIEEKITLVIFYLYDDGSVDKNIIIK